MENSNSNSNKQTIMDILNNISKRLKKFQNLEEWLNAEVREHQFCVVLFYRGEWGAGCWEFISLFNEAASQIRKKGGELFLVVPKNKTERKKMEKYLQPELNFKIISDPENTLALKHKISICSTEKKESRLSAFLEKTGLKTAPALTKCRSLSIPPMFEGYKVSHPGIVVLSSFKHEDSFRTTSTIKNHYASREYLTPSSLNELIDLHFGRSRTSSATPRIYC